MCTYFLKTIRFRSIISAQLHDILYLYNTWRIFLYITTVISVTHKPAAASEYSSFYGSHNWLVRGQHTHTYTIHAYKHFSRRVCIRVYYIILCMRLYYCGSHSRRRPPIKLLSNCFFFFFITKKIALQRREFRPLQTPYIQGVPPVFTPSVTHVLIRFCLFEKRLILHWFNQCIFLLKNYFQFKFEFSKIIIEKS